MLIDWGKCRPLNIWFFFFKYTFWGNFAESAKKANGMCRTPWWHWPMRRVRRSSDCCLTLSTASALWLSIRSDRARPAGNPITWWHSEKVLHTYYSKRYSLLVLVISQNVERNVWSSWLLALLSMYPPVWFRLQSRLDIHQRYWNP